MRRIRIVVEYDGTDFVGWQRQENGASVQAAIEDVIAQMTGVKTFVRGAGRTDAGVHALAQVAHFDTESNIPLAGFRRGLNALLPRAIAVHALDEAPADFDARRSAHKKLYRYRIWNGPERAPLIDRFVWHRVQPLDLEKMRAAARPLVGRHDFRGFRAADCERKTTERTLARVDVTRDGDLLGIEVEGDAFLKYMVRIIAGTLVACGHARLPPEIVEEVLQSGDRTRAGPTAPARGLTLVRVDY